MMRSDSKFRINKVIAGGETSFAIDTDKNLFAWGWNEHAQLGFESSSIVMEPRQVKLPRPVKEVRDRMPACLLPAFFLGMFLAVCVVLHLFDRLLWSVLFFTCLIVSCGLKRSHPLYQILIAM